MSQNKAGDITAIRDWANRFFYTMDEINNIFINGLDTIDLREPLYERVVKTNQSSVFTADKSCVVLAFNLEVYGKADSTPHRTSATITTTGTVLDTITLTEDFDNANHTRDTSVSINVIRLNSGDTITFTNSSVNEYVNRIHMVFDILNDAFDGVDAVSFSSYIDAYITQKSIPIQSDGAYLPIVVDVTNSDISSSFYNVDIIPDGTTLSTGRFIGANKNAVICFKQVQDIDSDSILLKTTNTTNYASKIFCVVKLTKSS